MNIYYLDQRREKKLEVKGRRAHQLKTKDQNKDGDTTLNQ